MSDREAIETLTLTPHAEGILLEIKAHAGAKRDRIGGVHDGALKVEVTAAPERGKANRAILALLAKTLAVAKRDVTLVAGETSARKKVRVRGLTAERVRMELRRALLGD